MAELGALSSYMLSMQQVQLAVIKNNAQMQQKLVEMLFDSTASVPVSENLGHNVDVSI